MNMKYTNKKYGFSFEIPGGWTEEPKLIAWFRRLNGINVSIDSKENDANFNVLCGDGIEPEMLDPNNRDRALIQFAQQRDCEITNTGNYGDELGGEENTVRAVYRYPQQCSEKSIVKISSYHNGVEYNLTFGGDLKKYKKDLETITNSFRFAGK